MPPEPSVEQARADRRRELQCKLDRVNAQCEELSARITEFLFEHETANGCYFGASLEEIGQLPEKELRMRQAAWILDQERAVILAELSTLTKNEKESVHVEGK